ncbi:MAG: hypothetical protein ABIF17_02010 [Patescibacteria group bacterium]
MKISILTRYIYYIFVLLLLVGLGFNISFLYNDFYKTMAQAEVVYILRSQVSFEIVNINLWDAIEDKIKHKKTPSFKGEEILNNPFADTKLQNIDSN